MRILSLLTLCRYRIAALLVIATMSLAACGDLSAALPARPTPFPTLARLPSVTPVTPRPTAPPTRTPTGVPTITPVLPSARILDPVNMRSGPGLDFAIIAVIDAGSRITLSGRQGEWYAVRTDDGLEGWMSQSVINVDSSIAEQVPQIQP
ncbi:MAG: SH3 domain-containing protein [Oscillochloris sp.]|nr:SH3 domain-containing protein [Oscillochloris sp.]